MSEFNNLLLAIHGEIWEAGTGASPELSALLSELVSAPMPEGITRLPSSAMSAGPHLAAQDEDGAPSRDVVWLESGRLSRARAKRFAAF